MNQHKLTALQASLRELLAQDELADVLAALKKALPERTDKYNLVFQLEARLNSTNKDRIRGVLSHEQLELAYNRLRAELLDLIGSLDVSDFVAPASDVNKAGSILYQIPRTMQFDPGKQKAYRCIVRLAYNDATIADNLDLTKDTVLKPLRVSEIMDVELKDPNETPAFNIRTVNTTEQLIDQKDYTEWHFYVKPLRHGAWPLLLVVAVKEYINNHLHKREIVLEEIVEVIMEDTGETTDKAGLQQLGYTFFYTTATQERNNIALPTFERKHVNIAIIAGVIIALTTGVWALGTQLGWFGGDKPPKPKTTQVLPSRNKGLWGDSLLSNVDTLGTPADTTITLENDTAPQTSKVKKEANKPVAKGDQRPKTPQVWKSGFVMVPVKGGIFTLGKHYKDKSCRSTQVNIKDFKIGKYEITQADWTDIMQSNPAFAKCDSCPVENVSWDDVQVFLQKASEKHHAKYRLPYEVEWEYAALGGQASQGFSYAGSNRPDAVAWYNTIQQHTHEVGLKKPNEIGLYDMSGNVREWCQGTFPPYLPCKSGQTTDKQTLRGGSWVNPAKKILVTAKASEKPALRDEQSGFRIVRER